MTTVRELIRERAGNRCEYCKVHADLQLATFHSDHIHPESRGGPDSADNRAFACPSCNLTKSNRLTLPDPETAELVPMFNPRAHRWSDHFQFSGLTLIGKTPIGRALVAAFDLNSSQYLLIRSIEQQLGLFPPPTET